MNDVANLNADTVLNICESILKKAEIADIVGHESVAREKVRRVATLISNFQDYIRARKTYKESFLRPTEENTKFKNIFKNNLFEKYCDDNLYKKLITKRRITVDY